METIDALAEAINDFDGGMMLVSHDFRLISQVCGHCRSVLIVSLLLLLLLYLYFTFTLLASTFIVCVCLYDFDSACVFVNLLFHIA